MSRNIVYFDLETQKSAQEVGGWSNISDMKMGTSLRVRELVLPEGITALDDPDRNILSVIAPAKGVQEVAELEEG